MKINCHFNDLNMALRGKSLVVSKRKRNHKYAAPSPAIKVIHESALVAVGVYTVEDAVAKVTRQVYVRSVHHRVDRLHCPQC